MSLVSSSMRHLVLALALTGAAAWVVPATAGATVTCKAKKKKQKTKRAKSSRAAKKAKKAPAKVQKINARAIAGMHRRGDGEEAILIRARMQGYKLTAKDERFLTGKKVPASLITSLKGPQPAAQKAKVDLTKPADIADIDFDSVPPPPGTPGWVAEKQQREKAQAKKIDHSLRPAAPFEEQKKHGAASPSGDGKRRVVVASDG